MACLFIIERVDYTHSGNCRGIHPEAVLSSEENQPNPAEVYEAIDKLKEKYFKQFGHRYEDDRKVFDRRSQWRYKRISGKVIPLLGERSQE